MTIDPLGIAAMRPGSGFAAQTPVPAASRAPEAATPPATAITGETPPPATMVPGTERTEGAEGSADALDNAVSKLNASVHAQSLEFSID